MHANPGNIEVVDDDMAAVLREKTGAERLRIAEGLFAFAAEGIRNTLRAENPGWDEQRITEETARRLSHGVV